jgi:hypothetical protein
MIHPPVSFSDGTRADQFRVALTDPDTFLFPNRPADHFLERRI